MKMKTCSRCKTSKKIIEFAPNGWCKQCMSEYRKEKRRLYKGYIRPEYSKSILSDEEIENEMKSIPRINAKGVNALADLTSAFDRLCKSIKSYNYKIRTRTNTRYINNRTSINSVINN